MPPAASKTVRIPYDDRRPVHPGRSGVRAKCSMLAPAFLLIVQGDAMKTSKFATVAAAALFLLTGAIAIPAHADVITTYDINFSGGAPNPTSGSFTYDSTSPAFTNFLVIDNGITYDLTASANAPFVGGGTGCAGEASTPAYGFAIISESLSGCSATPTYVWYIGSGTTFTFDGFDSGAQGDSIFSVPTGSTGGTPSAAWTITAVAAIPEVSSFTLTLIGCLSIVSIVLFRRKRLV